MLDKLKGFYATNKTYVHIAVGIIVVILGFRMFKK